MFWPGPRSTGTSAPVSSRSCSTRLPCGPGQDALQLVGVDEAATACADDLGGVVVEGHERLGRRPLDRRRDASAGAGVEADREGSGGPVGADHAALRQHLLDAGAVGQRRDLVLEGRELVEVGLDDRPHLHPHVVDVELAARRAARGAGAADRLEAVLHRALRVGQAGDAALVVADDGELAHLGQGDEPPVGGVLPRDALVEEHVLGRLDAGHVEVAQPPQVEATTDHRVHAADQVVLDDAAVGGRTEGEVVDRPAGAGAHGHGDPAYVVGEGQRRDDTGEARAGLLRRTPGPRASGGRGRRRPRGRSAASATWSATAVTSALSGSPSSATVPTVETRRVGRSSRM